MNTEAYFDSAATTPCIQAAAEQLMTYSCHRFGNPSSQYRLGQEAARAIWEARKIFTDYFQVPSECVVFTGSGTEANNLALYGTLLPLLAKKNPIPPACFISKIEHPAVRNTAYSLKDLGVDVQELPVNSEGLIEESLFNPNTATASILKSASHFVMSIMEVNNITGAVQSAETLAQKVKRLRPDCIFHSDSVQAFGKRDLPKRGSAVDLLSISAHKIGGPKGVGALIVLNPELLRENKIRPILWGGGQEDGLRSGTQNVGLIAAFGAAAQEAIKNISTFRSHALELRETFFRLLQETPGLKEKVIWNSPKSAAPHIVSISMPGVATGPLAKLMEEAGVFVSTGSACSAGKNDKEPVLAAMGLPDSHCRSALRISFGTHNTKEEVQKLAETLKTALATIETLMGPTRGH